jgi:hypothetical protein
MEDAKRTAAVAGCKNIATACDAYSANPANPEGTKPNEIGDLLQPPFGGPSYLRNREADTKDPWGKPYQIRPQKRADGSEYVLVTTTTPDGTPISQFGIGEKATPKV